MPQNVPTMEVFWTLDIGLGDRHDCEGMPGKYEITYQGGEWMLFSKWERGKLGPVVTYCPWCGEKLPEIVITAPEPTEEQMRKWRKQMKKMARKVERWLDQIEAAQ